MLGTCRALSAFETALFGPTFEDLTSGWRKYANETAFAHWFLAQELIKNVKHSYHSAAFMYKVRPFIQLSEGSMSMSMQACIMHGIRPATT